MKIQISLKIIIKNHKVVKNKIMMKEKYLQIFFKKLINIRKMQLKKEKIV